MPARSKTSASADNVSVTSLTESAASEMTQKHTKGSDDSKNISCLHEKLDPEIASNETNECITGPGLFIVSTGLTLATFLLLLDATIVATAIPQITNQFKSLSDVGWYGSAYLLAICAIQLPCGQIYQLYSSKPVYLSALVVFVLGSMVCGLARSSKVLILGRIVAGCGGGGIANGGLTIIAAAVPLDKRPRVLGSIIGLSSIGLILGPLLGGALTQHVTWRWCFYINGPIGAGAFAMLLLIRIPNGKSQSSDTLSPWRRLSKIDFGGCLLFAGSVVMILIALDQGGSHDRWNAPKTIGLFCGGGFTFFIAFLALEWYLGDKAMLPLSLFSNRIISCAAAANMFVNGTVFLVIYYLPLWFQIVKNASPAESGIYNLPGVVSQVFGTILSGIFVSRIGYYTPFIIIGCALSTIAVALMGTLTPSSQAVMWAGYQVLNGIGRGAILQQPITAVQANAPKNQIAIATALVAFCQNFGAAVFISLGQTTFRSAFKSAIKRHAPSLDAREIMAAGATAFRAVVPPDEVQNIVDAYNEAITIVFFLAAGMCGICFILSFGMGWKNLKAKETTVEQV